MNKAFKTKVFRMVCSIPVYGVKNFNIGDLVSISGKTYKCIYKADNSLRITPGLLHG